MKMNKFFATILCFVIALAGCDKSTSAGDASTSDLGRVDAPSVCADSGADVVDASDADVVESDLPEYNGCSR